MCINFIIICWSVYETEMTMEEVFFRLQSQSLILFLVPGLSMCFNGNKQAFISIVATFTVFFIICWYHQLDYGWKLTIVLLLYLTNAL
jgi:hypothetical protein